MEFLQDSSSDSEGTEIDTKGNKNRCRKLSVENNGADRTDTVKRQKVLRFSPEEGLYFSRIFVPLVSSQVLQKLKDSGLEAQKELMNSKKFFIKINSKRIIFFLQKLMAWKNSAQNKQVYDLKNQS